MLNGMVTFLQFYGSFGGGDFGRALLKLEELGFFDYLLPFLIIFAMIFGILSRVKVFGDNKGIDAIIAVSVGLMVLQLGFVSEFFTELFPRVGIGITVILVILIFLGLFMDPDSGGTRWVMFGIGFVVVVIILIESAEATSWWYSGGWWSNNIGTLLILAFFVAIIGIIVGASSKDSKSYSRGRSPFERALRGED